MLVKLVMKTIIHGLGEFQTGREARKARRRAKNVVFAVWGSRNQTLHHGGGERWFVAKGDFDVPRKYSCGPALVVSRATSQHWDVAGINQLGNFVSTYKTRGYATTEFLIRFLETGKLW